MDSVTCLECKSELPAGVEQCPECGFNLADAPPIKCPECAKVVVFTNGICPECGFPYDALDELLLDAEVLDDDEAPQVGSQAEQLPAVAKHTAAATAAHCAELSGAAIPGFASVEQIIPGLASYLEGFKKSNGSALTELATGVEKLLEEAERLKLENEKTLQGMQEIAGGFSSDIKSVVDGINSAKASAISELTTAAQQGKAEIAKTTAEVQQKVGGTVDYIFYICLAMLIFTAFNFAVTAYVVKLIK